MRPDPTTGNFHLYRSEYHSGVYLPAATVNIGDANSEEVDPAVAPDQSFLVFSSNQPLKKEPKRLRIAFREKDGWRTPLDLGDEVNELGSNIEARLSADHRMLYFSTNTVPPSHLPRSREQAQRDLAEMEIWANGRQNIWSVFCILGCVIFQCPRRIAVDSGASRAPSRRSSSKCRLQRQMNHYKRKEGPP